MSQPLIYSLPQRILHWLMALMIFFNLIFSDGMEHWNNLMRRGEAITADEISSANIHAYVGIGILILLVLRLVLRVVQGAPLPPGEEPALLQLAAKIGHATFYILFLVIPLSGMAKYYFGNETLGELHAGIFKIILWALIVVHIAAALAHQFYWKTNVLARMTHGKIQS